MLTRSGGDRLGSVLVLVGGLAFTFVLCVVFSAHRIFWSDELFGWMLLRDPSFRHMLWAWRLGCDGGGLLFYLSGRAWFALFGPSEMSFRLFSALGIYTGFAAVWLALRRSYPGRLLAPLLFAVWFATPAILLHVNEGRFYGMLLGGAGLVFLATTRLCETDKASRWLLCGNVAATLLLVGSHPLGLVYSGSQLCALLGYDLLRRRFRPTAYASILAGWSVLLLSLEAIRNSAAVGKPHFWTVRPHIVDLRNFYVQHTAATQTLCRWGFGCLLLALLLRRRRTGTLRTELLSRASVLLPAVALLLVPCGIWLMSQRGTSLFVGRYLLPADIGVVVALAELWMFGIAGAKYPTVMRVASTLLLVAICARSIQKVVHGYYLSMDYPPLDFTGALVTMLPKGLPVVVERADVADLLWAYQRAVEPSTAYLLDWETVMAPESPRGDVSGFHEMQNWRSVGYFSGSILDSSQFLSTQREFVVIDDPQEQWFERRILSNPEWQTECIGHFSPHTPSPRVDEKWVATLWRVRRR